MAAKEDGYVSVGGLVTDIEEQEAMKRLTPKVQIDERTLEYGRMEAENTALRAELVRWLETLTGTPLEALWELREPRMRQVSIQVNKKDYEAARKRLEELNNGNDSKG